MTSLRMLLPLAFLACQGTTLGGTVTGQTGDTGARTTDADTDTDTGKVRLQFGYQFADDPPDAYTRVDRVGVPMVASLAVGDDDAFNQADPVDELDGRFVKDVLGALLAIHTALDPTLILQSLPPCAPADCLNQAASAMYPDAMRLAPGYPGAFPNGRRLDEAAPDVMLAAFLLDLNQISLGEFAGRPLNPAANDVPHLDDFPFLGPPHE